MATKHHDTGYKELFSHLEFVQQLIEGFAPPNIAVLDEIYLTRHFRGMKAFMHFPWSLRI